MGGIAALAILVGFVVAMIWFIIAMRRRVRMAAAGAASQLGLSPHEFEERIEGWKIIEGYTGHVDGMQVVVAFCEKLASTPNAAVPICGVVVEVGFGDGVGAQYYMERASGISARSMHHQDPEFDKKVAVQCDDECRMQELLRRREVRDSVRDFLTTGGGHAYIEPGSAFCVVFNAQYCRADGVVKRVREAMHVVQLLRRTESAG